jgi:LacI family transcriptional regulator/LacI family purine nucleotide synthesis repressor
MASMKDISIACGVSVATVSKALNGHSDIGDKTKKLVKKVAKEMGYFPNSSARALKINKTYNLGVLFIDEARSGLTHDYFVSILENFKITAELHGYDITFINGSKQRKDRMSYLDCCRYRGVDGVVIACINFDEEEVHELMRSELPLVTIDHLFNNRIAIMSDNIKGVEDLVSYIYQRGHRKIAFIHGEAKSSVTQARLASFYKTTEKLGLKIPDEYIKAAPYRNTEITAEMTNELLDLKDPPTCILFQDDFASIGGINAIKSRGLTIPDDISVVGYDGIKVTRYIDPLLTTINQDTANMGRIAAERLIDLIEKPKTTLIEQILIPGELEKGASVKIINELPAKD